MKNIPPGTPVAYYPGDGHLPETHWHGVVVEHHLQDDGSPLGLTDVCCTDPHEFLNNSVGLVTTVETKKLRLTGAAPAEGPEQTALFTP
ncbi:hypothetical protein [Streptomyces sp. MJP52]|uniref:hypothetical protein n=1 Tax=Streptomyces sp. MJP52 TaxID=2940555 RepID=UPI0024765A84|nr:hypothetical protein [Streptomyces sp. MJP52]MDH6224319.1 hypothetical protein [Streptomyces sp. MJP52]